MDAVTVRALELAKESSDRARSVLLFLQVACIIIFMATWHETKFNWTVARLRTAQAAAFYLDCLDHAHPEGSAPSDADFSHDNCHLLSQPDGKSVYAGIDFDDVVRYIRYWKLTPAQARREVQILQQSLVDRSMNVSVPLLGFSFDINDLSLLGGLSLLLLMVWFYFSLRREERNLRILFDGRTTTELKSIYRLASMTQVMTIPPDPAGRHVASRTVLNALVGLLYLLPCLLQAWVLCLDWSTLPIGNEVNHSLVPWEFRLGCILCLCIAGLTWACVSCTVQTDRHWRKARTALDLAPQAG